jgi:hypothetical protein
MPFDNPMALHKKLHKQRLIKQKMRLLEGAGEGSTNEAQYKDKLATTGRAH